MPHCPVARSRKHGGKNIGGSINDLHGNIGSIDVTSGKGKTGVEFRYHTKVEYAKLPNDQKEELKMFREARKKLGLSSKLSDKSKKRAQVGNEGKTRSNKKFKTMMKGAVSKFLAKLSSSTVDATTANDVSTLLSTISSASASSTSNKSKMLANDLTRSLATDKETHLPQPVYLPPLCLAPFFAIFRKRVSEPTIDSLRGRSLSAVKTTMR